MIAINELIGFKFYSHDIAVGAVSGGDKCSAANSAKRGEIAARWHGARPRRLIREGEMPRIARLFFQAAVVFLIFSMAAGLQMSISGVHNVTGAHAHASLLGWATGAIFGTYYALDPAKAETRLAYVQFWVFVASAAIMSIALYFLLLGYEGLAPLVAAGSILSFVGAIMFAYVVFVPSADHIAFGRRAKIG